MLPYSLLDLAPVPEGLDAKAALANAVDLAQFAEQLGHRRVWYAEHHNMPGIASAATSVLIGHVAGATNSIRVGAGGIMLPNHSPMVIAEQFGTLATLYPDRIDLGLGRAPGTDQRTLLALRRDGREAERFPRDVVELLQYFEPEDTGANAGDKRIRAVPAAGTRVPVWILGSSTFGAQLAAELGLPYAFASHFAPAALEMALRVYRQSFRPSRWLEAPKAMMAVNVFAADTEDEARYHMSSMILAFARLRLGQVGLFPRPVEDVDAVLGAPLAAAIEPALSVSAVGTPDTVRHQLQRLVQRHQPDELILTCQIHDHAARRRALEIASTILSSTDFQS